MAYDQHAAYQPPSRHYYPPQQSPAHDPRAYDQGYNRGYNGYEDHGVDHGYGQGYDQGHDQGYDQGYGHPGYVQEYGHGHNNGQQHHGAPRARQEPGPRAPPQRHGHEYENQNNGYDRQPRQVYQQPQYANSMPQHPNFGLRSPPMRSPPMQGTHSLDLPRGQSRQKSRPPPLDRSFSDDLAPLKKGDRVPLIEPVSPTELPQDNAFPTFPVAKQKPSKQQLREAPGHGKDRPSTAGNGASRGARSGNTTPQMQPPPGPPRQYSHESQSRADGRQGGPVREVRPPPQQQNSYDSSRTMPLPMRPGTAPNGHRGPPMNGHGHPSGPPQHARNHSQSEIYADYYGSDLGAPQNQPRTRDEEIEQDMPNFDNAAQMHTAHKRGKTVDEHLTSPAAETPPPMPRDMTPQQGMYQQQSASRSQVSMSSTPGPGQGRPNVMGGMGPHPANQPPQPYQNQYASRDPYANSRQAMGTPSNGFGPRPAPRRPGTADAYGRPSGDRNGPNFNGVSQSGRAPSAPPLNQNGYGIPHPSGPPPNMNGSPHPDALPHHPVPVRPGLMDRPPSSQSSMSNNSARRAPPGSGQPLNATPGPMRNYAPPPTTSPVDSRRTSIQSGPVTMAEINHLQSLVNAHPQDFATALLLAKKLVEASTVLASENGRLDARQTTKNRERYIFDAHRRVKKLVSAGYPDAMFYLADCYGQGLLGLEEDPREAFNLYQQAAKLGHANAAYRTAVCCELGPEDGGGTRRDVLKAVQWYRRAAQLQDVSAMFKLGMVCLKGLLGQQKNIPEAERWLKRAAERADKENPHALHELGCLYEVDNPDREVRGKVVADEKYARELFFKAAELGFRVSQNRLGQAYEYGALGLEVNARNSIAWYSKAAAQGDHQAELALSGWYLTGAEGILENSDQEAYLWARKAASADPPLAKAMFAMGYYTETGIGCPANLEEAKRWYGRAASYKFPKAIDRLEEIRKNGGKIPKEVKGNRLHRKDMKGAMR
ncbi:Chitin synthase regulatory factor 3 [Sphaceloma murrayae]|uniref:Chitin synthase regulatory factor 3 n=1 Tax=Sphaceloma murrayae TaxID=2082308 RepID=A0A2K1QHX2_9PEZI|nr:Chitin synthase regulatory factor 3 [Sphaceloma murrayae]